MEKLNNNHNNREREIWSRGYSKRQTADSRGTNSRLPFAVNVILNLSINNPLILSPVPSQLFKARQREVANLPISSTRIECLLPPSPRLWLLIILRLLHLKLRRCCVKLGRGTVLGNQLWPNFPRHLVIAN